MIKFQAIGKNGVTILGFGLTEESIRRLKADQPIQFPLDPFGIEGHEVVIFFGETEESIAATLKARKLIPEDI